MAIDWFSSPELCNFSWPSLRTSSSLPPANQPALTDRQEETCTQFRLNQHITDQEEINRKIFEGESRHDIGWHYKIPYPRLHNFPTGSVTEKPSRAGPPSYKVPSVEMGSLDDTKPFAHSGGWASLSLRC